jgi:hypothetical protein
MRIAFDLDGLLIPAPGSRMLAERLGLIACAISREPMRAGAPALMRSLRQQGHEVWIYTTSLRSPRRLRFWFACLGVRLHGVVNKEVHDQCICAAGIACSKYPPAFEIGLLIDDSEGVSMEGKYFGFSVLLISEDDRDWSSRILLKVDELERSTSHN